MASNPRQVDKVTEESAFLHSALPMEYWDPSSKTSRTITTKLATVKLNRSIALPTIAQAPRRISKTTKILPCLVPGCNKVYKSSSGLMYHEAHGHKNVASPVQDQTPLWTNVALDTATNDAPTIAPVAVVSRAGSAETGFSQPLIYRDVFGTFPMTDSLLLARCQRCNCLISTSAFTAHQSTCSSLNASSGCCSAPPSVAPPHLEHMVDPPSPPTASLHSAPDTFSTSASCLSPLSWRERAQLRLMGAASASSLPGNSADPRHEEKVARYKRKIKQKSQQ